MISEIIDLNTSFFIEFAFGFFKKYLDYYWDLSSLQQFYHRSNIPDLIFIGIDYEKALIRTLDVLFF